MSPATRWTRSFSLVLGFALHAVPCALAQSPSSPQVVARTSIGPQGGPTLLRTVLPLPIGENWLLPPGTLSPFSFRAGGDVFQTQFVPCRRHYDGSPASIELTAWCPRTIPANEPVEIVRTTPPYVDPGIPNQTIGLFLAGFGFRVDGADGLVTEPLNGLDGEITFGPSTIEIEHGGQLAQYGGYRYWLRALRNAPLLELDFLWHNGDTTSPDPDIRFDLAAFDLPPGWRAFSVVPRPDVHLDATPTGNRFVIADGGVNTLLQLHEHHVRLVLYPDGWQQAAERLATYAGWGVCLPDGGLWSFWNSSTPWYTAHGTALPVISNFTYQTFVDRVRAEWSSTRTKLLTGQQFSGSPHGKLGWLHMRGTPYGGPTGGDLLEYTPGFEAVRAGVPEGLLDHVAKMWVDSNRGSSSLFDAVGDPIDLDLYVAMKQLQDELDFRFELLPEAVGEGHTNRFIQDEEWFGFSTAGDRFSSDPGAAPYEATLRSYGSYDAQHGGRYLNEPLVLASMANDRIAKHMIVARAAANRADNWEGEGDGHHARYGWLLDLVQQFPAEGSGAGRAEGWNLDIACEAYSFLPAGERQWLNRFIDTVVDIMVWSQVPMGFVQVTCEGKAAWSVTPGGSSAPEYRCAAQPYEGCIQVNGLVTAAMFVYPPGSPRWVSSQRCLLDLVRSQAWAWHPSGGKTWGIIALRENESAPLYPTQFDVPADGKVDFSSYYLRGPLAYGAFAAYRLGDLQGLKDVVAITNAYANGKPLIDKMQENYLQELGMKAHLWWVAEAVPQAVLDAIPLL
ncbi:MAG: hypothetical protein R3F34_01005 [Planctomycetota bacterium]